MVSLGFPAIFLANLCKLILYYVKVANKIKKRQARSGRTHQKVGKNMSLLLVFSPILLSCSISSCLPYKQQSTVEPPLFIEGPRLPLDILFTYSTCVQPWKKIPFA